MKIRIPLAAVSPLSPRQKRIYDMTRPTASDGTGIAISAGDLAAKIKAKWHALGYYSVQVWVTTDEAGRKIVASNLVGGLPPIQDAYVLDNVRPFP